MMSSDIDLLLFPAGNPTGLVQGGGGPGGGSMEVADPSNGAESHFLEIEDARLCFFVYLDLSLYFDMC